MEGFKLLSYSRFVADIVELIAGISSSSLNVNRALLCSKVDHYASTYGDRGWGCGYR